MSPQRFGNGTAEKRSRLSSEGAEGCFHLLTPFVKPTARQSAAAPDFGDAHGSDGYVAAAAALGLSANFPGVTLSTVRQRTRTP